MYVDAEKNLERGYAQIISALIWECLPPQRRLDWHTKVPPLDYTENSKGSQNARSRLC